MNIGVRCLYGASKQLPRLARRTIATEASSELNKTSPVERDDPLEQTTLDPQTPVRKTPPKIHEILDENYEIGGHIKYGPDPLDRHDEKGIPKWGKWGIPIKLTTPNGSFGTTP
jgi:hypothetical protein